MAEQSSKHGPVRDEQMAHEVEGLVRAGHRTHAEEWREAEYPGEDQPAGDQRIRPDDQVGHPRGMTPTDVEARSELARYLSRDAFPGDRDRLVVVASEHGASDAVVTRLASLPPDETFANVQDVATALGIGAEPRR